MRNDIVPPKRPTDSAPAPRSNMPVTATARTEKRASNETSQDTVIEAPNKEPVAEPDLRLNEVSLSDISTRVTREPLLGKRALVIVCGAILGVVSALLVGLFIWYTQQINPVDPSNTDKVVFSVDPGSGLSQIAEELKDNQLIKSELAFEWYVRSSGKTSSLQSGSYRLSKSESVPAIVNHLTSGNTDTFSITFLPGATLAEHRQGLIDAGYTPEEVDGALAKSYDHPIFEGKPAEADLEGFIFGETYNFPAEATVEQILNRTFDQFDTVVAKNDLVSKYKQQGFTLYQGITMASIIQREVASPDDAAQVAQVFKTRYDMGMQLGSDVTYQYIADKTGQARSVDLDSPYNTRRYPGLPPGPISSPGADSLIAVGSPAPGDYIYFLSGDDDKTYFARTNEEHERNIRDHCQKKCQII